MTFALPGDCRRLVPGFSPSLLLNLVFAVSVYSATTENPIIAPAEGRVSGCSQVVTISCPTSGAVVYYSTDGTDPSTSSTVYSAALTLSATTKVKAMAIQTGMTKSPVVSATYIFSNGNIALNRPVAVSSIELEGGHVGSLIVDGNQETRWACLYATAGTEWVTIDLGPAQLINYVGISWQDAYAKSYKIQTSLDDTTWFDQYSTTTATGGIENIPLTPVSCRYLRVYMTQRGTGWAYSIREVEVGVPNTCTGIVPATNQKAVRAANSATPATRYDLRGRAIAADRIDRKGFRYTSSSGHASW